MNTRFRNNLNSGTLRITATIGILVILMVVDAAVAQTLRTKNQSNLVSVKKDALIEQIEKSPNFSLNIYQDEDTPLKIIGAEVKEISGGDYEKLTSEKANFQSVVSAPTVQIINTSDKTISQVMIVVADAQAEHTKGLLIQKLSIQPGAKYTIYPENFVKQEVVTKVDENNNLSSTVKFPMKDKKFWLPFPDKAQLQVRVGVFFEDGTKWFNRSQRGEN